MNARTTAPPLTALLLLSAIVAGGPAVRDLLPSEAGFEPYLRFTKEGSSEKMLLSPAGGAAAFVGSTNTCFTTSLGPERRFWDHLFTGSARTLGEALSAMRAEVTTGVGPLGFLRLSFALLGDPATASCRSRWRRPIR